MEAVFITGTTEQARFEGADFPLDVRQFGCVLKGDITHTFYRAGAGLELGFASGDNSTQDSTLRNIKFDPSYKVGMILFEEVLARISARSHDRVRDPELVGTPPKGSDLIPTNGSVTNAIYIHPQIFVRPDSGAYDLRLGFLAAFAPGDVVDPFASAEAGGFNRNAFRKKNANGALGYEVNAGLAFDIPVQKLFTLRLGGQYGIFFPGAALEAVDGVDGLDSIQKWRLLADLRW